jgi:large subunit ribosomal protein L17
MRHRVATNRLSRRTGHRKAMLRNMLTSLFRYERITTTKAKALVVRSLAEKMITRAKSDSVHNRRLASAKLYDEGVVAKLYNEIGPRFTERPGGYTRILKTGYRRNDAAEMVILELVEESVSEPKKAKAKKEKADKAADKPAAKPKAKKAKTEKAEPKKEEAPAEEAAPAEDGVQVVEPAAEAPVEETPAEETPAEDAKE